MASPAGAEQLFTTRLTQVNKLEYAECKVNKDASGPHRPLVRDSGVACRHAAVRWRFPTRRA